MLFCGFGSEVFLLPLVALDRLLNGIVALPVPIIQFLEFKIMSH